MAGVKTRRQASSPKSAKSEDVQVVINGTNGVNGVAHKPQEPEYPRENIFLFIPNVIGKLKTQ